MKLVGEFTFNGEKQKVWDILLDPEILVLAIPGTESLDKKGEGEYVGEMNVRIGPLNGKFLGNVKLTDLDEPNGYNMVIDSKGPLGFGKGTGNVKLTENEDKTTLMTYTIDLKVGGKIASVGQRLLETVTKSLSRQSLETLNSVLQKKVRGEDVSGEKASQAKYAKGVTKDIFVSVFTSPITWIIIAGAAALGIWFFNK